MSFLSAGGRPRGGTAGVPCLGRAGGRAVTLRVPHACRPQLLGCGCNRHELPGRLHPDLRAGGPGAGKECPRPLCGWRCRKYLPMFTVYVQWRCSRSLEGWGVCSFRSSIKPLVFVNGCKETGRRRTEWKSLTVVTIRSTTWCLRCRHCIIYNFDYTNECCNQSTQPYVRKE